MGGKEGRYLAERADLGKREKQCCWKRMMTMMNASFLEQEWEE